MQLFAGRGLPRVPVDRTEVGAAIVRPRANPERSAKVPACRSRRLDREFRRWRSSLDCGSDLANFSIWFMIES
jgi:hypothetical protein